MPAARPADAALVWLPVDGALRLAWHVVVTADEDVADVLVDAQSERAARSGAAAPRDAAAVGRIFQSAATAAATPRQPDTMPLGGGGTPGCPPPANYELRALDTPVPRPRYRRRVVRAARRQQRRGLPRRRRCRRRPARPTSDGWLFDFPFNSAGIGRDLALLRRRTSSTTSSTTSASTRPPGTSRSDNFGRGGAGGDPLQLKRARPDATMPTTCTRPDGSSPTINMFLWDGAGCWGADVDGDGSVDLDGDYDLDILVHEFHHGVSLRLNTAFTGNEAGAIGEGGGDFFAYSVNDDPALAEYARPGGLRAVNGKGYGDWSCLLGLVLRGARQRRDLGERAVGRPRAFPSGRGAAAAPRRRSTRPTSSTSTRWRSRRRRRRCSTCATRCCSPTRARNPPVPRAPTSAVCGNRSPAAAWASPRSTPLTAGLNQVTAAYDVPAGCVAPPGPPVVSITTAVATANEAGADTGERDDPP